MNFGTYQTEAVQTANKGGERAMRLCNWSMGLAGETGELVDLLKKHVHHGHELDVLKVKKELGDVLWYLAMLCEELNLSLDEVAQMNIEKLRARYPSGFSTEASVKREPED